MISSWLDRIGDWNPQLSRELKGRLKSRNALIAMVISLVGQLLVVLSAYGKLPQNDVLMQPAQQNVSRYCTGNKPYPDADVYSCLSDGFGNVIVNWQSWWLTVFLSLSFAGIIILSVVGTYLLVSDLNQEERRGTLNFIRLSPQPTQGILLGKLLGVPSLLYLVVVLALPLHIWAGQSASISLSRIAVLYIVLAASCLFFYSVGLLYGLVGAKLGDFQAWLGGGVALVFYLWLLSYSSIAHGPVDWLRLFSPTVVLPYVISAADASVSLMPYSLRSYNQLQWFDLPISGNLLSITGFTLLNCGLWTYWVWQSLQRCFRNRTGTILSKRNSYLLVACFEILVVGFALQTLPMDFSEPLGNPEVALRWFSRNLNQLLVLNLLLSLVMIAVLSPHRQTLQDWARYRRDGSSNGKFAQVSLLKDLVFGEDSPALVAIAFDLILMGAIASSWVMFWAAETNQTKALLTLVLNVGVVLICAAIAQLMLLMKTPKRVLWAFGTVLSLTLLPALTLQMLSLHASEMPILWLFSAFPGSALPHVTLTTALITLLGQFGVFSLLSLKVIQQLRKAGKSASKALLMQQTLLPGVKN